MIFENIFFFVLFGIIGVSAEVFFTSILEFKKEKKSFDDWAFFAVDVFCLWNSLFYYFIWKNLSYALQSFLERICLSCFNLHT